MTHPSSCTHCGGELERPVVDIGVGNMPMPYVECTNCLRRFDDPPVEGLLDLDDAEAAFGPTQAKQD